tara:strand:+ start:208 stop:366 length:159 start_codon:yes stop_codon:yes gene_type:complete
MKYYGLLDYIILDLPGSLNVEMVKGLLYVEHIFIPFKSVLDVLFFHGPETIR